MAEALLQELRPYLVEARTTGQDVTFGVALLRSLHPLHHV